MDRYAIFVDAGYFFAAGGQLVHGQPKRHALHVEPERLLARLQAIAAESDSGDFLRMYWYDAAINAVPQPEHRPIAEVPGIKLRLGRQTRYGQKGVDSLVVRDMMRLASEHAISTAFLMTGDEDLRQGMVEAQDYGVKVVLLGIEAPEEDNQADTLVWEADGLRILRAEEVTDCLSLRSTEHVTFGLGDGVGAGFDPAPVAAAFGREWAGRASEEQLEQLRGDHWIPAAVDTQLIGRLLEAAALGRDEQLDGSVLAVARRVFRETAIGPVSEEGGDAREPVSPAVEATVAARAEVATATAEPAPAPVPEPARPAPIDPFSPFAIGQRLARSLLSESEGEAAYLRTEYPRLPRDIDGQLLRRLVSDLGLPAGAMVDDEDRKAGRAGFWSALGFAAPDFATHRAPFPAIEADDPERFGEEFGKAWLARCSAEEMATARRLLQNRLGLPADADRELLRLAAGRFGDPVSFECRTRLREGFERAVRSV